MSKKKINSHHLHSKKKEEAALEEKERKKASFERNKKYLLPLLLNTVLFYGVYAVLCNTPAYLAVLWIYFAALLGFSAAYVIYNRGFFRKNLTVEMLPDTMSLEEKEAFLNDVKHRADSSKWMITIIFPLVMTFMIDIVILFMLEPFMESLGL